MATRRQFLAAAALAPLIRAVPLASFKLGVMVKSNSPSGYVIGVQKSGTGATTTFAATEYHAGDTVLLAGKYDFTVSPNAVSLWLNPNSSTFAAASAPTNGFVSVNTGTDAIVIDRFNIRQNVASGPSSVPAAMAAGASGAGHFTQACQIEMARARTDELQVMTHR